MTVREPLQILVVDDEDSHLAIIRKILEEEKYKVQTCSSSHQALGRLRENRYDAGPLTVYAFQRESVDASWVPATAESMAGLCAERWDDEYGGDGSGMHLRVMAALTAAVLPLVQAAVAATPVWHCEVVASREYSAAEVRAILGET